MHSLNPLFSKDMKSPYFAMCLPHKIDILSLWDVVINE